MDYNNYNGYDSYNQNTTQANYYNSADREDIRSKIFTRTYLIMLASLLVTAFAATITATVASPAAFQNLFTPMLIIELVVAIGASAVLSKGNTAVAAVLYAIYTVVNGVTMAVIFFAYDIASIQQAFMITALLFGVMAVIGTITKADLTNLGAILTMALIGVILVSVVNMIFGYTGMDMAINYVVVFIFIGLTAYDAQKTKVLAENATYADINRCALFSGMQLYLDFINLFLRILAIMGKRRN